jgi:hypothetical protein
MFPCDSLRLQGLSPDVAKKSDQSAGALDDDNTEGLLAGLFAEENELNRRALWRIGSWGVVAVAAVVIAVYANQASLRLRGDQMAADDFARQAQQVRQLARESQVEARKLASAVDTLNGDRDRLYSRVTVLEQGLDSVTGAIAKQAAATAKPVVASSAPDAQVSQQAPPAQAAPLVGPVASAPAASAPATAEKRAEAAKPEPQVTATVPAPVASQPPAQIAVAKSMMGPPDPAAPKLIEVPKQAAAAAPAAPPAPDASPKPEVLAAIPAEEPKDEAAEEAQTNVQRTEFAVDLGTANSVGGLRNLWRTVVASNAALKALTPIILVRENKNGLGAQLRLAAGPLQDAATAAKICAALAGAKRSCETTVYDGQRLAMARGEPERLPTSAKPEASVATSIPAPAKRTWTHHAKKDDPPPEPKSSGISSWFNSKKP